ncbi:hypothetical protein AMATHDRAFT_74561 [Amanita thiersii Skay4041]|uniref:G-patch domain-containing protein n=1 Tax=Amanita thiersii Skay4041 TaxID=703135 RepID=A0A2A9NNG2_9AGAR|nr:hypothetical protein AMATHDRAFT_74561 [Amanita thiersii Skay4041]
MSSSSAPKVSFTIRRPSPVSRTTSDSDTSRFKVPSLPNHLISHSKSGSPLARNGTSYPDIASIPTYHDGEPDSSDEEDEKIQEELVTSFDQIAFQRSRNKRNATAGPLVIPALQNKDWRAMARKRRNVSQFVPASAQTATGKDGSVGGLGIRDTINSGPVLAGLQVSRKSEKLEVEDLQSVKVEKEGLVDIKMDEVEETEDQRALRAILAGVDGGETAGPTISIIPTPVSETDALRQDLEGLPDVATLEDYGRVPVSEFGAAMLRGMGWTQGAASRKPGKGLVEPYIPQARPALLGIGAKEREIFDDGSKKKFNAKPERRYVPIIKKERDSAQDSGTDNRNRSRSPGRRSGTSSKRTSRSPDRRDRDRDRDQRRETDNGRRDSYYYDKRSRDKDRYRERDRDHEKDYRRDSSDRDKQRDGSSRRRRE